MWTAQRLMPRSIESVVNLMSRCSTGCITGGHNSFGECLREKKMRIGWCNSAAGIDLSREKRWQSDLDAYASARRQGVQPETTWRRDVDAAMQWSEKNGAAFVAT